MENLHLKNLQNSTTLDYLIKELKKIEIINKDIKEFKDNYIDEIKQYKQFTTIKTNDLNKIKNSIIEFKHIKNITIGSSIDVNDYDYEFDYDEDLDQDIYNIILIEYEPINNKNTDIAFLELIVIDNIITNIIEYH